MSKQLSYYKKRQAQQQAEYRLPERVEKMLTQLRMPALRAQACALMSELTPKKQKDFEAFLADIAQAEVANRAKSALAKQRKTAGLPTGVTFDYWDETRSTIPKAAQEDLKTLTWIDDRRNLILVGPHGTGKSMFTELLANEAISAGKKVKWLTMEHLGAVVSANPIIATRTKAFERLAKHHLLVIDDVGLIDITDDQAEGFLRLITATYGKTSIALTSNYHPSAFDQIMPIKRAQVLAAVDRLLHRCFLFQTQGQSQRLAEATNAVKENATENA